LIAWLHKGYVLIKCIRGGPLDILGRGVADPKKKFMQGVGLEKKIPASTRGKKKNSCNFIRNPSESSHCVTVYHY
jgi:hypothetical protein